MEVECALQPRLRLSRDVERPPAGELSMQIDLCRQRRDDVEHRHVSQSSCETFFSVNGRPNIMRGISTRWGGARKQSELNANAPTG